MFKVTFHPIHCVLLNQVTKLIDELGSTRVVKSAVIIPEEKILDWLVENKVLSIALEGKMKLFIHSVRFHIIVFRKLCISYNYVQGIIHFM